MHVVIWGPHVMGSFTGRKYLIMFIDEMPRMRWIVLLETKEKAVEALKHVFKEAADPEGLCVDRLRRRSVVHSGLALQT